MRRLARRGGGSLSPGLDIGALAPMVDMMTVLLVLLLRSYATDPAPMPPAGHLELADTLSEDPRRPATEILVSDEAVYVNGQRVIAVAYLPDSLLVRELYDPLLVQRDKARVEIHAHRAVSWHTLERVLHTAQAAGYQEIALVGIAGAGMR